MIQSRLHKIFDAYIKRFDELNDIEHREFMKWEAAEAFSSFDFSTSEDFVPRLKKLAKTCEVIIDSRSTHPLNALIKCASNSPELSEQVRKLFLFLFEEDGGNLTARQSRIEQFIEKANRLAKDNNLGGYAYENTQTSAMAYLALRMPEENCLLSTSKASEFAKRVGFTDDWGTLSDFNLDVYYRFCNELSQELKSYAPIMKISNSRFDADFAEKHAIPDMLPLFTGNDIFLLAFDIIHCSAAYGLWNDCPVDPKLVENIREAQRQQEILYIATAEKEKLAEAEAYWKSVLLPGLEITHKVFGNGSVVKTEVNNGFTYITAVFPETGKQMKIWLEDSRLSSFVSFTIPDDRSKRDEYLALLAKRNTIEKNLIAAQTAFEKYKHYL